MPVLGRIRLATLTQQNNHKGTISLSAILQKLRVGVIVLILEITACTLNLGEPASTLPSIPTWNLILDAQPFPAGWIADPCGPPQEGCERQYREMESYQFFGRIGIAGHVLQRVFRLPTVKAAEGKVRTWYEVDFKALAPPPQITYRSPIADEYYLGCGMDRGGPVCRAIFRYSNYFVYWFFIIDDGSGEGLKLEEVEPILRAMDERAAAVLGLRPRAEPTKTP
jgi:hypothetical protein